MPRLCSRFSCTRLPLSVSYRCARAIVEAAQAFCPQISSSEGAPAGVVEDLVHYDGETFGADDGVICRNTAPLLALAYGLVARSTPFRFLGRDIGANLVALVEKLVGRTDLDRVSVDTLLMRLDEWKRREIARLLDSEQEDKVDGVCDKASCLQVVADSLEEGSRTVQGMLDSLVALFAGEDGVTLCTIHKSKGLEWTRIFLLDEELMPSPWAKRPWMLQQEYNLHYVAITRAKTCLTRIRSGHWRPSLPTS